MGKTVNQFRRLCSSLSNSPNLIDNTDPTYSPISSLDTEEAECETLKVVTVSVDQMEIDKEEDANDEEEDEDDQIFKVDTNIE